MDDIQKERAEFDIRNLIDLLDSNSAREGLRETPKRFIKFMNEFLNPPTFNFTTFDSEGHNEMVIVKDIPFYSLCEHHLAPFFGVAHVGYVPNGRIVGLSKLPRVVDLHSRRFQNQERITTQVADYLVEHLAPLGVGVILQARHMCMEMRGVQKAGTQTITSAMRGVFENENTKQELLKLIR